MTSRFKILDDLQLDFHVALSSYLAKKPVIYPEVFKTPDGGEMTEFLFLDDIDIGKTYQLEFPDLSTI